MTVKALRRDILIIILLGITALIPRTLDLGIFLTADEKNWMQRSDTFIQAAMGGNIADMMLTAHPGVTTMWLTGTSMMLKAYKDGITYDYEVITHYIKAAQLPIATMGALLAVMVYVFIRQLFPSRRHVPLLAGFFVALNPYLIGHTRVVHVDGLLMIFVFLSVLASIIYADKGFQRRWLFVAAFLAALAILTKAPGIFTVLFLPFVVLVYGAARLKEKRFLVMRIKDFSLFAVAVLLSVVIIWPTVIWPSSTGDTLLILQNDVSAAVVNPHDVRQRYRFDITHYPAALLTRTTPLVLLFVIFYVIYFFARLEREKRFDKRSFLLMAYVVLFMAMMTLGAKKGDRYILPVWPALDVLAALGVVSIPYLFRFDKYVREKVVAGIGLVMVLLLAVTVYRYHPYAISYANPLLPDNLSQEVGWGEGLEKVGAWLDANSDTATVASWYPQELQPFTKASVAHIQGHDSPSVRYVVLYRNMFGRADDYYATEIAAQYYGHKEPIHVVELVGKEFAWIYEREAYETIAAELDPGVFVGQKMAVPDEVRGLELLLVTYSGLAK